MAVADLGRLLLADVIVEVIWQWPGVGALTLTAVQARNGPLLASNVILLSCLVTLLAVLSDIASAAIDPRIKAAYLG